MSLVALEIPKVGLVMESARLVRWLKNVGELVKQGEPLLELETEKSVVEIESTESGRLVEILLQVDQEARVGDRVAWLENDPNAAVVGARAAVSAGGAPGGAGNVPASGESASSGAASVPASGESASGEAANAPASGGGVSGGAASAPASQEHAWAMAVAHEVMPGGTAAAPRSRTDPGPAVAPSSAGVAAASTGGASGGAARAPASQGHAWAGASGRIKSSPVARRVAAEHSLDLRQVQSTGPRGRVQLSDVRREIESRWGQQRPASAAQVRPPTAAGPQPLSSMRRAVARSMTLSNATIPQFIVERAVDWTALQAIRAKLTAESPASAAKPTVNDFLLQAIARTLLAFPELNATFSGDATSSDAALLPATGTHIGLVVAVESGLLVPVLHDVDRIGILELARRRNETVQRALSGKLKREELEGATFSLSNLGARGPDRFTAIISPPQSAILAVGRQRDCVVAMNGGIHVRPMSQLTLTIDHRVADGRLAADFLAALVETLESNDWRLN